MAELLGIGERLRNAREAKGLTLEAMEGTTRIRAVYLRALEDEQFDRLPGGVYARGFLRAYASALGLNPDHLLDAYPQALAAPAHPLVSATTVEIPIRPAAPRSPLRRVVAYAGMLLLAAVVGIGIAGYVQLRQFSQPVPPEVAAPPVPQQPPAPPKTAAQPPPPVATSPPQVAQPKPLPPAPVLPGAISVEVRALDTCWVRVAADGERVFEGFMRAGDVRVWRARQRLTLRVGNSPAVSVWVNGKPVTKPPARVWEQTFQP